MKKPDIINLRPYIPVTGATQVTWCKKCGCPVVVAPMAMAEHYERVHHGARP